MVRPSKKYANEVGTSRSGSERDLSMPPLDPLLDLDWSEIPDVPNDVRLPHLVTGAKR